MGDKKSQAVYVQYFTRANVLAPRLSTRLCTYIYTYTYTYIEFAAYSFQQIVLYILYTHTYMRQMFRFGGPDTRLPTRACLPVLPAGLRPPLPFSRSFVRHKWKRIQRTITPTRAHTLWCRCVFIHDPRVQGCQEAWLYAGSHMSSAYHSSDSAFFFPDLPRDPDSLVRAIYCHHAKRRRLVLPPFRAWF